MKLLSFIVPCYNSMAFMRKCVESLLPGGDDVEILLVNDGSSDETGAIADSYRSEYPDIVRVFHQQNAGHGGAVNTGMQNAKGVYLKVVDSDDWVDSAAYRKILETLRRLHGDGCDVDMFISNYVYDKVGAKRKKVMRYSSALREQAALTWDDVGRLSAGQYILMHSVIYRTALLHECGLTLPEHTFYVDNLYVYQPLPHVKSLYYLDVDFYHYLIGHEGQSVQESTMIKRINQQLRVNRLMLDATHLRALENRRQKEYMLSYLNIVTTISSILLIRAGTPEHLKLKRDLWRRIKQQDSELYRRLRYSLMGIILHMPKPVAVAVYRLAQKIYKFN